jgi:hypothetical protein
LAPSARLDAYGRHQQHSNVTDNQRLTVAQFIVKGTVMSTVLSTVVVRKFRCRQLFVTATTAIQPL